MKNITPCQQLHMNIKVLVTKHRKKHEEMSKILGLKNKGSYNQKMNSLFKGSESAFSAGDIGRMCTYFDVRADSFFNDVEFKEKR